MASLEFIQKRIEGKEKEIATLNKKLDRILKAQATNWEKNPYWYSERDLTSTQRDITTAQKALQDYKDQLTAEIEKANSRNIPVILEFLAQWKVRVKSYYKEAMPQYNKEKKIYSDAEHEYVKWYNAGGWRSRNDEEYKLKEAERKERQTAFKNRWGFLFDFITYVYLEDGDPIYSLDEEKLQKVLDQEANAKYDFIVERTNAITGQITDASNLRIGAKGDLNGFIIGEKGTAKVSTISAEGPIQCFHYRTLIHKMN